jgi:hypothetical protein
MISRNGIAESKDLVYILDRVRAFLIVGRACTLRGHGLRVA